MTELIMLVLVVCGLVGWRLGGSVNKVFRRFLWPILGAVLVWHSGMAAWRALAWMSTTMLVNCLPYGDRTPWPIRWMVWVILPLPALWLSMQLWWVFVFCGLLTATFFTLSRKQNNVSHAIPEMLAGLFQAACAIMGRLGA